MSQKTIDLILHPVRIRILMALSGAQLTARDLAERLPDIPQATLYRQLNRLCEGDLLEVVEERHVRGAVEKVYTASGAFHLGTEAVVGIDKDEHMRYFTAFVTTLLDDFSRYLQRSETVDYLADGVGYQKVFLELSDEEFGEMAGELNQVFLSYSNRPAAPNRRRRLFATIVMPDDADLEATEQSEKEAKP